MSLYAVTVIGHDRPGIIAEVTSVLATSGGNLEDSTMTLLRGHFAMTVIVSCPAGRDDLDAALRPVTADGSLLVSVREVPPEPEAPAVGSAHLLRVHGADRPGIVSAITRLVADAGGNITDATTRLTGDQLYLLVAEVDLPPTVDVDGLNAALDSIAGELGVEAGIGPADHDVL